MQFSFASVIASSDLWLTCPQGC